MFGENMREQINKWRIIFFKYLIRTWGSLELDVKHQSSNQSISRTCISDLIYIGIGKKGENPAQTVILDLRSAPNSQVW